jgi:hypothetical protein
MFCNNLAIKNNNKPWPCVKKSFKIVFDTMAQRVANILVSDKKCIVWKIDGKLMKIDGKLMKTFST